MSSGPAAAARLSLWLVALVAAIALLTDLGRGTMGVPVTSGDPVALAFALLRTVTLALAWYLLAVTLAGAAGRCLRLVRVVAAVDRVTLPVVRGIVQSALGAGVAAAITLAAPPLSAVPAVAATVSADLQPGDAGGPDATPRRRLPPIAPLVPVARSANGHAPDAEWTVRAGESFWSIAAHVLAEGRHAPPRDGDVARYWEQLIRANRSRLPDRANPDVIYPGLTLRLPPR